jgi:hypothetical protein
MFSRTSSGMLRLEALVTTILSGETIVSIIRVIRIGELGTTLAVTSNWSTLRSNTNYMERISELGTTLAVTSNWSTLRSNTNYMERISELGTTLAVTSNWSTLRSNTNYMERISELGTTLAETSNWSTRVALLAHPARMNWLLGPSWKFPEACLWRNWSPLSGGHSRSAGRLPLASGSGSGPPVDPTSGNVSYTKWSHKGRRLAEPTESKTWVLGPLTLRTAKHWVGGSKL